MANAYNTVKEINKNEQYSSTHNKKHKIISQYIPTGIYWWRSFCAVAAHT